MEGAGTGFIAGRYHLQKTLKVGPRGRVIGAFDTQLSVHCVIKRPAQASLFAREHEFLSANRDLIFPRCFDPIEFEGGPALVMEFRTGRPLARLFASATAPVGDRIVLDALMAGAKALSAVHASGHTYGPIAPEDLLVADERVSLLDFGDVKPLVPSTSQAAASSAVSRSERDDLAHLGRVVGTLIAKAVPAGGSWLTPPVAALVRRLGAPSAERGPANAASLLEAIQELRPVSAALLEGWSCECGRRHGPERPWRCECGVARREPRLSGWIAGAVAEARSAAKLSNWKDAASCLDAVSGSLERDDDVLLFADALGRMGRQDEAIEMLRARDRGRETPGIAALHCRLISERSGKAAAAAYIDRLGDLGDADERLVLAAVKVLGAAGRVKEAEGILRRYLAGSGSRSGSARYFFALLAPNGSGERRSRLEESVAAERTPVDAYLELSKLSSRAGDHDRAFRLLFSGRDRHPDDPRIAFAIADLALQTESREPEATELLLKLHRSRRGVVDVERRLVAMYRAMERWQLLRELGPSLECTDDPEVSLNLALAELETGSLATCLTSLDHTWSLSKGKTGIVCLHGVRAAMKTGDRSRAQMWRRRLDEVIDDCREERLLADQLIGSP